VRQPVKQRVESLATAATVVGFVFRHWVASLNNSHDGFASGLGTPNHVGGSGRRLCALVERDNEIRVSLIKHLLISDWASRLAVTFPVCRIFSHLQVVTMGTVATYRIRSGRASVDNHGTFWKAGHEAVYQRHVTEIAASAAKYFHLSPLVNGYSSPPQWAYFLSGLCSDLCA
jgi:hypothetical protein